MSTIIFWLIIFFLLWFVITNPTGAASVWHGITGFLAKAANGLSTFLTNAVHS
jgi:hypothetical protein